MSSEESARIIRNRVGEIAGELKSGKSAAEAVSELTQLGLDKETAIALVSKINDQIDQRKRAARSSGMESIFGGLVLGGIGAAITAATYSAAEPGGSYVVTSGLFFVGGWYVLRGLVRMMTTNP